MMKKGEAMDEIKATDLCQLLKGRMGLILGPSITKHPECFTEVNRKLGEKAGKKPQDTYLATADTLLEQGSSDQVVQDCIRQTIGEQAKSSLLSQINKVRWKAVLSASLDA